MTTMRSSILAAGLMVLAASAASAVSYDDADLLKVSEHANLVPFANKIRDVIQQAGHHCDGVDRMNAYPSNGGIRAVVYCSAAHGYEGFLENGQARIVPLQ
jgi:hypothetical protein